MDAFIIKHFESRLQKNREHWKSIGLSSEQIDHFEHPIKQFLTQHAGDLDRLTAMRVIDEWIILEDSIKESIPEDVKQLYLSRTCPFIITRGPKKGQPCGKMSGLLSILSSTPFCDSHDSDEHVRAFKQKRNENIPRFKAWCESQKVWEKYEKEAIDHLWDKAEQTIRDQVRNVTNESFKKESEKRKIVLEQYQTKWNDVVSDLTHTSESCMLCSSVFSKDEKGVIINHPVNGNRLFVHKKHILILPNTV